MVSGQTCLYDIPQKGRKVIWELTNKCNFNCVHCCNKLERSRNKDIDLSKALSIVSILKDNAVSKVVLGGGEPLLFRGIVDLLNALSMAGMNITLASNGYFIERYIDALRRVEGLKVVLSLDGFSESTHDVFRGKKGAFRGVMTAIRLLTENEIPVKLGVTIHRKNLQELDDIVNFARSKEIEIAFHSIINTGQIDIVGYAVSQEEYQRYVDKYSNLENVNFREVPGKKYNLLDCPAGKKIFGIKPTGLFTPCHWISYQNARFDSADISKVLSFDIASSGIVRLPCRVFD